MPMTYTEMTCERSGCTAEAVGENKAGYTWECVCAAHKWAPAEREAVLRDYAHTKRVRVAR